MRYKSGGSSDTCYIVSFNQPYQQYPTHQHINMFKTIFALSCLLCVVKAGYLTAPLAYHAPIVKAAVPVATSYQNTYQISSAAVPVVVKAAPVIAAPAVHYAAAPAIIKSPLLAAPLPYAYH
ncbi:cuticle protein 38 [Dendroctonus ponderosae]|uniref:Cuticle protein n=2 Tax=Dendroctonus ponderosae TaxID=77166 RepID=A0AAR5P8L9_DENPD|nr:cuticle protein 38 [Dendroctonus ponderosae]